MRIAEMEAHHTEFVSLERTIQSMVNDRDFPAAFSVCETSFPHIEPTIRFRKKREIEPTTPPILAFAIICRYAPVLFEHTVIESLIGFVQGVCLLARHENNYLQISRMTLDCEESARMLWNLVEQQPGVLQQDASRKLGIDQHIADTILGTWDELNVIDRKPTREDFSLQLRSRLDATVEGMCPSCGVHGKGHKEAFFKRVKCERCGTIGFYHLTGVEIA